MPASRTATETKPETDYDAFFQERFEQAKRDGLSDNMARFLARNETLDRICADQGRSRYGAGDFELIY